ncbi:MAG TPA: Rid family hydrolase [Thermoanaerobaculia bacterium]|jgi:chorismate lyase/3-hydroxybenzoate synthase
MSSSSSSSQTATEVLVPAYVPAREVASLPEPPLAVVSFGERLDGATIHVPMPQLGRIPVAEVWPARREPRVWQEAGFTLAEDGQTLFGAIAVEESEALEPLTRGVYSRAIALVRKHGYPYFLRMWNHVGDINGVDGGTERYQRFCVGRWQAFAEAGYALASDLPAASAVGIQGARGLVTYFVAGRAPGMQVENPRQVSAYHYPRRYGPKSPSFSRATVAGETLFISGTASVVGHETVHAGNVTAQLDETLRNIGVVAERALPNGGLANVAVTKTYVRDANDQASIAAALEPAMSASCAHLYLAADICRADLLLEIEAVARNG